MHPETALWYALEYFPGETTILREWRWALKEGFAHVLPFLKATGGRASRWPVFCPRNCVEYFNLVIHTPNDVTAWHEDGRREENIPIEKLALFRVQVPEVAWALAPYFHGRTQNCSEDSDGVICVAPSYRGSIPVYLLHTYGRQQLLNRTAVLFACNTVKCHLLVPTKQYLSAAFIQLVEKTGSTFTVLEDTFYCVDGELHPIGHVQPIAEVGCWPYPIPSGMYWKDVTVKLNREGCLFISLGKRQRKVGAKDVGLTKRNSKGHKTTTAWTLLLHFVDKGTLYADDLDRLRGIGAGRFKHALRSLRHALSAYFPSIPGDPIQTHTDQNRENLSQAARTRYEPAFRVGTTVMR